MGSEGSAFSELGCCTGIGLRWTVPELDFTGIGLRWTVPELVCCTGIGLRLTEVISSEA